MSSVDHCRSSSKANSDCLHFLLPEHFLASASCHQEAVEQAIMALQMDRDSDVKYFASTHPASTRISEDALSTASSTY